MAPGKSNGYLRECALGQKAAEDCRTPRPSAVRLVSILAKRLGVRQSSGAFDIIGIVNRRFLISILFAVLLAIEGRAQGTVSWRTNYYSVSGATLWEISQSLNHSRPWKNKSGLDGLTDWRVDWKFNVTPSSTGCHMSYFTTTTTINITLPKWTAPTNASPRVEELWTNYITALGQHEFGHGQIAVGADGEIHKRIKEIGEDSDCARLKDRITTLCRGIVDTYKKRDDEYDVRTEHGAKQGARFPTREPGMHRP